MRVERDRALGLERLVVFSDAVFAIAITLLALDLRLPDRPGGYTDATLLEALGKLGPSLFATILSFVVIAALWVGHFRTYRLLAASGSPPRSSDLSERSAIRRPQPPAPPTTSRPADGTPA